MAFAMFWEILWALILGFGLSGTVQAVVSKREMRKLLPDDSPRSLAVACACPPGPSRAAIAGRAFSSLSRCVPDFEAQIWPDEPRDIAQEP
jgi:hypothetical protein